MIYIGSSVTSNRSLANLMISGIYSKRTAWELGHNHHIEFNLRTRLEHRLLSELHQLVSECPSFLPSFPSNHCILRESARTLCALRKSACKVYLFSLITLLCQTISVKHCFASISLHLIILSKSLITASNSRNFKIRIVMCTVFGLTFLPFSRLNSINLPY